MAKYKHNKKKNSAFLYEALVLELTKAILKKDLELKNKITKLIKESFRYNTILYQELKLYHALSKTQNVNPRTAEKIFSEVKERRQNLDKKRLVSEQSTLVRKIKKSLSPDVMDNFVPNYKSFATIYQIFNHRVPIKTKVLLENSIIKQMSISPEEAQKQKMVPIDNLVYKTFTKKFNQEYAAELLSEQKELLSKFVSSFVDNNLQLKTYLNEEIKRLKNELNKSLMMEEFVLDKEMQTKAKDVINILESYKHKHPGKEMVQQVIKVQSLVHEIKENAVC